MPKPRSPDGYDIADSASFVNKPALGFTGSQEWSDYGEEHVRVGNIPPAAADANYHVNRDALDIVA